VDNIENFLHFVNRGFASPRKYISNSLAAGLKIETNEAAQLLEKADIETIKRAENLTLEQWRNLYELYLKSTLSEEE
jgi:16S rRNA A1518/A1519 N6-dimethyltransferase RsmA/KsgA/DIM1 with predicted DNA glycosylase/AP lyase activity